MLAYLPARLPACPPACPPASNLPACPTLASTILTCLPYPPIPLLLVQAGPEDITGAANYYLDVYDSAGEELAARIWVLDSMDRSCEDVGGGW